jgi:hypothetical protein
MEKPCKNCEYFVQESIGIATHAWGYCRKPAGYVATEMQQERGVFVWADKTCADFKPERKPE